MPIFLRNESKRVSFSPHSITERRPLQPLKFSHIDKGKACRWGNKQTLNRFSSSPAGLLRHLKANVARTLSLFTTKRHSSSRDGPSNPNPNHLIPPRDSHHSEALEDCIEFINSSHRKSL